MIQGSDEWKATRLGKVTASRTADVMARTKSGYGASRANYMAQLIIERLTGNTAESYTNAAMQHGIDTEPQARLAYSFMQDREVEEVAFIEHPTIAMSGASPDGHIGLDGMLEIKCPNTATHLEFLLGAPIDDKYIKQMQWQMACAGRQWCDYVSYDPRMPENLQMKILCVKRDDDLISVMESEVLGFLAEVDSKLQRLKDL